MRQETKQLYSGLFKQLALSADQQAKVVDILTQPQRQIEQQAFEAAQSGRSLTPPSPNAIRAEQAQQDQQLRSALGETGFAAFNQYRATIPDRIIIGAMNEQGANLSDSQAQQLLQVMTEARQQVIGQSGIPPYASSMPPDQTITALQRQQALLQQTVSDRTRNLLTPEQAATLQTVMLQFNVPPTHH
jgi:hypothetical protein